MAVVNGREVAKEGEGKGGDMRGGFAKVKEGKRDGQEKQGKE